MKLGDRLKYLREKKGLKRKEIAEFLNTSAVTYGRYEKGERQPDYQTLLKVCDYYGVLIDYLIDEVDLDEEDYKEQQIIEYLQSQRAQIEKRVRRVTRRMDHIIEGGFSLNGEFNALRDELRNLFSELLENKKHLENFISNYDVEDDIIEHLKF